MAVPIDQGATFHAGNPRRLFDGIYNSGIESGGVTTWTPERVASCSCGPPTPVVSGRLVRVVLNWGHEVTELLRRR
jgi:hypothetical protein